MHAIPYILSALCLLNTGLIWKTRSSLLIRDIRGHRTFMMASLSVGVATILLFAFYLWARGLRVLVAVPELVFGIYVALLALTMAMLVMTMVHKIKNCHAPYNDFAPKSLLVWGWTSLLGIGFFPLTDAYVYPISS